MNFFFFKCFLSWKELVLMKGFTKGERLYLYDFELIGYKIENFVEL